MSLLPKSLLILALVLGAAAQYDYGESGSTNIGGRVIAGVLVGLAGLTLLLTLLGVLRRRRRLRSLSVLPPPGGPVATESYFTHPSLLRGSQTQPGWSTTGVNQLPAYTPPPPPYHRKETFEEETIESVSERGLPQPEYAPPLGTPPPAHVHDGQNRFGWFSSSQSRR